MRVAGEKTDGLRLRALIVLLWRAGLRVGEALALAALWADKMQARLDGIRPLAAALAGRGMLAPGITADRAADVIWTLGSHETYQLLVNDRGWDPGDYQEWLTRTLKQALLPPAVTR
jgi:hypothetical protein